MDSEPTLSLKTNPPRRVLAAGATWIVVYLAARYALEEMRLGDAMGIAAAFAPLFAFFWFVSVVQRAVKGADELQRLIQLEALALSFSTTVIVLMTLGLLDIFHGGRLYLQLRDLWAMLPVFYAICFAVAYQRFR